MKQTLVLILLFFSLYSGAQVITTPLERNISIERFLEAHPNYEWGNSKHLNKWGVKDTLSLPFFDDFTISSIYPDSSKWLNNQVYINNHFPVLPPTLGVATFDVLDAKGVPYNGGTINKNISGPGDSLISQAINLKDSAGIPYTPADSIYLSFFIQANGYGYHLKSQDSIRLFFKTKFNSWIQVWSKGGSSASSPFEQVMIPIKDTGYLHSGFQFMFTTYSRQVGNANHWHLDYVYINTERRRDSTSFADYAIQTTPTPLLKNYYEMPYSHFIINPAAESADSVNFKISNLHNSLYVIEAKHTERFGSNILVNTNFATNSANLPAFGSTRRRLNAYNFYSSLSGPLPVVIDREIRIRVSGALNKEQSNDSIVLQQRFYDYFAYDDGTAEQGFGFDHLTNPSNIEGEIAYKFTLSKADTLYAIATHFNRSVFDVSRETFTFRVWQSIAEPGSGGSDVLLYESEFFSPQYVDQINKFSIHYLDTTLVLPAGDFYIGWYQRSMFNLNVGWDRNSGNIDNPNKTSDKLFYKLFGEWSNANLPYGTLMMRPYVGSTRDIVANVNEVHSNNSQLNFYPNPATRKISFTQELAEINIVDLHGKTVLQASGVEELNVEDLVPGMYYIQARNYSNKVLSAKLIIFAH